MIEGKIEKKKMKELKRTIGWLMRKMGKKKRKKKEIGKKKFEENRAKNIE